MTEEQHQRLQYWREWISSNSKSLTREQLLDPRNKKSLVYKINQNIFRSSG